MQKWYNELSKGQKLATFIPSLALGLAIGGLGDAGGALVGGIVVIATFIFFELGSKK